MSDARLQALVRAAVRRHALVRALEGAALGLAAGGACYAAALLSTPRGPGSSDVLGGLHPGSLLASALAAAFCAVTWSLERRLTSAELVRRVDRATGGAALGPGGLVTAVECAAREANPLERALIERAARAVDPSDARRAIAPPAVALLAAPLVAAAAVSFLLERGPRVPPELSRLSEALVAAGVVPGGASSSAAPGPETARLERLLDEALAAAEAGDGPARARALEALARALQVRGSTAAGSERSALERAARLARAAGGLPGGGVPEPTGPAGDGESGPLGDPAGEADVTGPGEGGGPGGVASASGPDPDGSPSSGGDLAPDDRGVTMSGSPSSSATSPRATGATETTGESGDPGAVIGRTWDPRHDGVVSRWVGRPGGAATEAPGAGSGDEHP